MERSHHTRYAGLFIGWRLRKDVQRGPNPRQSRGPCYAERPRDLYILFDETVPAPSWLQSDFYRTGDRIGLEWGLGMAKLAISIRTEWGREIALIALPLFGVDENLLSAW